jgi:putative salt-induced outer membrane protein YdiY
MKLKLEVAPGYRIVEDTNNNTEEDAILRLSEVFSWKLSKTSTFDQNLKVETGDSNTETRFGIALTNQVAGNLSMKVAYNIKHNSDVADGVSNSDRETAITLVYKL